MANCVTAVAAAKTTLIKRTRTNATVTSTTSRQLTPIPLLLPAFRILLQLSLLLTMCHMYMYTWRHRHITNATDQYRGTSNEASQGCVKSANAPLQSIYTQSSDCDWSNTVAYLASYRQLRLDYYFLKLAKEQRQVNTLIFIVVQGCL